MPPFLYTAKTETNEEKTGSLEAGSASEVARLLREQKLTPISIKELHLKPKKKSRLNLDNLLAGFFGVPLEEKMMFARHLGVMIGAGLSLNRALDALSQQIANKKFAKIISRLNENIKKGGALADSLSLFPNVFNELFVNMAKVGETSGNLEEVLRVLAEQMKKDFELRSKIKSAMIYPSVIIAAMLGIGAVMMITVVPKLSEIFKDLHTELPLSTQFLIFISNFLNQAWPALIIAFFLLAILARYLWRVKTFKNYFDFAILRLPVFGEISKKINSARLARTLGVLIKSGVPIVQGLNIVAGTLTNLKFRQSLENAAKEMQKGQSLSLSLKKYPSLYPAMVNQMTEVGEETGTLDEILLKMAEFYEEEVANITKGLAAIIEPILMVVIGAAVGFFAISMLTPMYSIMQSM